MILLFFLIITEILAPVVLREHFRNRSGARYKISIVIHIICSIWVWITYIEKTAYNSFYDNPRHVWLMMDMTGLIVTIIIPRIILIVLHYIGKLIHIKRGGYSRKLTATGLYLMIISIALFVYGSAICRFNFEIEPVTIDIPGLKDDLNGLRIVQISDLHLPSFYHHKNQLKKVIDKIDSLKPDIIFNTGDFISIGWREFEKDDTILAKAKSKYGNYAILGNHDAGTYDPDFTEADRENNILILNKRITASGYTVLNNESKTLNIGGAKLAIIGVTTSGKHLRIRHGNVNEASAGTDSADLRILLTHDPKHWTEAVKGKTNIEITLSGHTHGMQIGIMTKKLKWSPAKYIYHQWNGLYYSNHQYLYVNRGLGVLAVPIRIWMPPEITIITLRKI